jgi:hypothetical protein
MRVGVPGLARTVLQWSGRGRASGRAAGTWRREAGPAHRCIPHHPGKRSVRSRGAVGGAVDGPYPSARSLWCSVVSMVLRRCSSMTLFRDGDDCPSASRSFSSALPRHTTMQTESD